MDYQYKYIKYKTKYLNLQKVKRGGSMNLSNNKYYYIHCISYYIGNKRLKNIQNCIDNLNKINYSKNTQSNNKILFIINCINDNITDDEKLIFERYKMQKTNILDIEILYRWNSGGTVRSIEESLDYILRNNIKSKYIGIFEDDSFFNLNTNYIFDKLEELLSSGYDIVGCHVLERRDVVTHTNGYKILNENYCNIPCIRHKHVYLNNYSEDVLDKQHVRWIDGAVYLTTIDKLTQIKKKLGKLTLAPNERYKHIEQGINYGEVGFPTRLHLNGFSFTGLGHNSNPNDYFKYLDQHTIGDKGV